MIPSNYHSYDDAVRGEVTARLDGLTVLDRVRYTDAHVKYLAERLIMPRTNGTYTGSSDPGELYRLADALGILEHAEPVACPVPWCAGSPYEHDGDPANFEHSPLAENSDSFAPRDMLRGELYQVGNSAPFYRLDADQPPQSNVLLTVSEVRALADDFERHAVTLRERAAQLEALGGLA